MDIGIIKDAISGTDIYILDQILKNRYQTGDSILDAGCGNGRNLKWFYQAGFEIHGIDTELQRLNFCKGLYATQKENFIQASISELPFKQHSFNHILCNAVLHFAEDFNHFLNMFEELLRVLKPNGSLFIRMASEFGIENQVELLKNGTYNLPDGSTRFLLTSTVLEDLKNNKRIMLIEDVKTTIVHNKRSMTTLVIEKL
ncbi:class I SAM-dependent methyltransferase [Lutibacter maritimus]|uniref:Methyltransferase domain-containing protein n=1 Tax=Lutibacter maritimus TaxID=593133 RepID=A0A1I6P0Z2_9FLAO|nr:class I SAM-dependent methyltransferase [Lutibacter maritimus]SFS33884.1 Methyltransferase domain-containing protein [Lutibacter maritimus]